ncbi:5-dehydro-2-deoxygluconokinase [soil metagenome]
MSATPPSELDLVCVGRLSVDLYGEQQGSALEHLSSLRTYLGGSAANVCVGTARLGLRTAMLSRVGADGWGTFLRDRLVAEGVDVSMLASDPDRLTAAVALAVRESDGFPRMFLYRDSADMATAAEDVDADVVTGARAVLVTGSFLANPTVAETTHRVIALAKRAGARVVLDIDFRPSLWGLAPLGEGQLMAADAPATGRALQQILPDCDLVVGTEEEIAVAAGETDIETAVAAIRSRTTAAVVVKSGALGATVYPGSGEESDKPVQVPGFAVEVFNTVGAGDGFLSGFLSGWLDDLPWHGCTERANATGALVVSRHGCSVAMPFAAELHDFLGRDDVPYRVREDTRLALLHRHGARRATPQRLHVLAIDHRWQLEEIATEAGADQDRIRPLKELLHRAYRRVVDGSAAADEFGLLVDDRYGPGVLEAEGPGPRWVFRALDEPRSRPVEFVCGADAGGHLRTWPAHHTAKLMVWSHPDDDEVLHARQLARMAQATEACWTAERELLLELQSPAGRTYEAGDLPRLMTAAYAAGARPDWWKLPPLQDPAEWKAIGAVVGEHDADCRGVLVLGHDAGWDALVRAFDACAGAAVVRGFAVGRTIFAAAARAWLAGALGNDDLVDTVAERFAGAVAAWDAARPPAPTPAGATA